MRTYFILILFTLSVNATLQAQDRFDICPLKVGQESPSDIQVQDLNGNDKDFGTIVSEKPTVVIFYRGGWCGYCIKQLSDLRLVRKQIDSLGYQLLAVTPDSYSNLEKSEAKAELDYPLYSDSSAELISAFGLQWKVDDETIDKYLNKYELDIESWSGENHHLLPVPAVYVIKDGVVQFNYVNPNHSIRLSAQTLLAVLETL